MKQALTLALLAWIVLASSIATMFPVPLWLVVSFAIVSSLLLIIIQHGWRLTLVMAMVVSIILLAFHFKLPLPPAWPISLRLGLTVASWTTLTAAMWAAASYFLFRKVPL